MPTRFQRFSKVVFIALVALAVFGLAVAAFVPTFSPERDGCVWTADLVPYVSCDGVPAGDAIAFALNLPFWVFFYLPVLFTVRLLSGSILQYPDLAVVGVLDLVVLVVGGSYPIRYLVERVRRGTSHGDRG